ncbi:MAG: stimulus-sensing domain-containing protein [Candidatus Latescibacterota bacterium]
MNKKAPHTSEGTHPDTGKKRRISPLTRRILAINVAALLVPIIGLLYLGPYRDGLVESELDALRLQAETFAGAIGEGAIEIAPTGHQLINLRIAKQIVWRLSTPGTIRSRLFAPDGALIADSRYLMGRQFEVSVQELNDPPWILQIISNGLKKVSNLMPEWRNLDRYVEKRVQNAESFIEVSYALSGEATGYVRAAQSDQLLLSVAVPVQRYRHVLGALMVSKNDTAIEAAMQAVRVTVFAVFATALILTTMLSLYLASTLARPILHLATAAERVRRGLGRGVDEIPDFTSRNDEIGDLSGVLRKMTSALDQRMDAIEKFAADVSHEIKNPLTSLRSAVETAARIIDPEQQKKLMVIIQEDVQRLDRLITDISNASRLDAELSRAESETVDIAGMLGALTEIYATQEDGISVIVKVIGDPPFRVTGMEDRLVQVFRNLIQNAISFSPIGGSIQLNLSRRSGFVQIDVLDEGRGLPESKLAAVFERFYSERPEGEKFGTHSGLGLSISKQIVEAHSGEIYAENRYARDGTLRGARFVILLPINQD